MSKTKDNIYFLGIGGIGMSAIARYFLHQGKNVAGYDRTSTPLTRQLEAEGAAVHYDDSVELIASEFKDKETTLVVYTPAVPADHSELCWFRERGFEVVKRSEMLGHIAAGKYVMAVAGTHGKTTTTTMVAWLNHVAGGGGSAFLGGISRNFESNLVLGKGDRLSVEADEFDRSFLRLFPDVAVVTSTDADHLDIYGTHQSLKDAFSQFVGQIKPGGSVIVKHGVELEVTNKRIDVYRYSYDKQCDFFARNIELVEGGHSRFDIVCPDRTIEGCTLGIPGWINVENAIAAVAMLWVAAKAEDKAGFEEALVKKALAGFAGVKRRFEFYINTPQMVYMDDYAHHPRELEAAITSVKKMFPGRRMTAVFQPHLYSRTNDFYPEFAEALSHADEVILLPIYPARELPVEGVTSQIIADKLTVPHKIVPKEELVEALSAMDLDVVVTFGAGDIDMYCVPLERMLKSR